MNFDAGEVRKMCDAVDADISVLSTNPLLKEWIVRTARRLNEDEDGSSEDEDAPPIVEIGNQSRVDPQYEEIGDDEEPPPNETLAADRLNFNPYAEADEDGAQQEAEKARVADDPTASLLHLIEAARMAPTSRRLTDCASALLELERYEEALATSTKAVDMNPDSARSLRTRSRAHWMLNDSSRAYGDMCEAQRIDYNEEFDALHAQMRKAVENEKSKIGGTSTGGLPGMPAGSLPAGMDFASLMNNPAVMGMAQNLMQNPELMQQMMSSMGGGNRR